MDDMLCLAQDDGVPATALVLEKEAATNELETVRADLREHELRKRTVDK
jgi:hypothetical protein